MSLEDDVREQVLNLLHGSSNRRFEETVRDFPAQFMNANPPNVDYTPWHLLEHLRLGQWDILEYIRNPAYAAPSWPDGYWPSKDSRADVRAWTASLENIRIDRDALEAIVADRQTDLMAPLPRTPGHTVLREAFLVARHGEFHLGEFAILRQVMKTWPADRTG
jgi:DinB superfamily